ncbi:MAG: ATP-binding protein [Elusimicrobiaceae bacterium]|nr:ATP-binding protein [Elusimicrobiota bacterium]
MKSGHLRNTVFAVIVTAALIPAFLIVFYMMQAGGAVLKNEQKERFEMFNNRFSNEVASYLSRNERLIETFLEIRSAGYMDDENYSKLVEVFLAKNKSVIGISFLNHNGREISYHGIRPKIAYNTILPDIISETLDNKKVFVGSLNKNPSKNLLSLAMSFPDFYKGVNRAVLVQFDMKDLEEMLKSSVSKEDLTLIFTKNGFLIFSSTGGLSTELDNAYDLQINRLVALAKNGAYGFAEVRDYSGVLGEIPSAGWLVFTGQASGELILPFKDYVLASPLLLAGICLIIFAALLILSAYLSGVILRPVKAMTKAVIALEQGSETPYLPAPDNEIGVFSKAFARMLDTIKIQFDDMRQERQDLEELNQSLELRVGSRTKELRTALNELIKKERLAAIGQMASIVSHEIKNPLAVIKNAVYLIKMRLGEKAEPKILKNISVIDQEIQQANGIIEEILGYARSREQILTVTDLTLYMKEILASYPMPENIKVVTEYAPLQLPVKIDTEEMKQGIRNIIGNAVEVMPDGGQLIIKTVLGANYTAVLSIRDSGPGIPKEIRENIFAPFFTTKARGTGLGLAVVKKVAGRNNVQIELVSEEGKGTKISMIFKMHREEL